MIVNKYRNDSKFYFKHYFKPAQSNAIIHQCGLYQQVNIGNINAVLSVNPSQTTLKASSVYLLKNITDA